MKLKEDEKAMLAGEFGQPVKRAIEYLIKLGEFFGAEEFVDIRSCWQDCSFAMHHEVGLQLVEELAAQGGKFRAIAIMGPCDMPEWWQEIGQREEDAKKTFRLIEAYKKLGGYLAYTCISEECIELPAFGEHCHWGGSNLAIYVNSVLGARTNVAGVGTGLMCAITGKTPKFGLHLDENRLGKVLVQVDVELKSLTDWDALGYYVGMQLREYGMIPVFQGLPKNILEGARRRLDGALMAYGTMGMYHIVGSTPEAPTLRDAFGGRKPLKELVVTRENLDAMYDYFPVKDKKIDLVIIGCPQTEVDEIALIADMLKGRRIHPDVAFWINTTPKFKHLIEEMGYAKIIEDAGGRITYRACVLWMTPRYLAEKLGYRRVLTPDIKYAHYLVGYGMQPVFRPIPVCIESAIAGELRG